MRCTNKQKLVVPMGVRVQPGGVVSVATPEDEIEGLDDCDQIVELQVIDKTVS